MKTDTESGTDTTFWGIVSNLSESSVDARVVPENRRISVLLNLPHVQAFGFDPTMELVYGCVFEVKVGDLVSCPPTPRNSSWTTGVVTSLTGGSYQGRVKYVKPLEDES